MFEALPKELKENALFCLWKYKNINGRITKAPYQINGYGAKTNDRSTFYKFDKVIMQINNYDGIGIGLFDNLCAIDIDNCIIDGQISNIAKEIINVVNSYTEISPSGKGIRIVFKSNIKFDKDKYYINNRKIGLEIYICKYTNRFVTITGNALKNSNLTIEERNTELCYVLEKYMQRQQKNEKSGKTPPTTKSTFSDEFIIEKIKKSKQCEKFTALWQGIIPKGKSHSEADQSLCNILAFWCGGNIEQIDRLFRKSGLMREKWNRSEYMTTTIANALKITKTFYNSKNKAIKTQMPSIVTQSAVIEKLQKLKPTYNRRYRNTDIGFGRLFADVFKDIARYVPERKKWYVYNGKCWKADTGSLKVMEMCKELADALIDYAMKIKDDNVRNKYIEDCIKWQIRKVREIYIKEAQSIYPISMCEMDSDKHLFNCENGTFDLSIMQFREHRATDKITRLAPVIYNPDAKCERFTQYIDEIMSEDIEKARFLQKILGYTISGDTKYECLFFLYGATTRNGKGTLTESILKLMGDYGKAVRPETIALKQGINSHAPTEDIARLAGVRFANISEPCKGLVLNSAQIKSMTGNDTLNARYLNENSFDFKPQFKLYINTNFLPIINDMTLFTSGRIIIIPFDRHFEEWEQDKTLKTEFAKINSQSAILNWLIDGYKMLNKEGLQIPQSVRDAIAEYSLDNDKIKLFANDCLENISDAKIKTADAYKIYKKWCSANGNFPENIRNFNHSLKGIGKLAKQRPSKTEGATTFLLGYRSKNENLPLKNNE